MKTKKRAHPPPAVPGAVPGAGARRRARGHVLSAEEFIGRLRVLYVHLARRCSPSVALLSRASQLPYESLRHFLEDDKHVLCPVNEEKLARALGHDGVFFRWVVRRHARMEDWLGRCVAACRVGLSL